MATEKEGNLEGNLEGKKDVLESGGELMTTKVTFNPNRFKTAPDEIESVTNKKSAEKFVRDTNKMMEEVKELETGLIQSVKRQEILAGRIFDIGDSTQANSNRLTKRQETNNQREEQKIEQLNEEVGAKLTQLEEKRGTLKESVPTNIEEKIDWIESEEGQNLIGQLLATSLVENNEQLKNLANSMHERDVINEDPKSEYSELITRLGEKHEFLVTEGSGEKHISEGFAYEATYTNSSLDGPAEYSVELFGDEAATNGHGLLISSETFLKNYKLKQKIGQDNLAGVQEFNFFEIDEKSGDLENLISRAENLKFEGNTLEFTYLEETRGMAMVEVTWSITASESKEEAKQTISKMGM